jgi:hypothetical protein
LLFGAAAMPSVVFDEFAVWGRALNASEVADHFTGLADLALDLDSIQDFSNGFSPITYSMHVTNLGPSDADAPNTVTLVASLPQSVTFDHFPPPYANNCTYTPSTRTVTCTTQTLDFGESATYLFVGLAGVGTHTVTAVTFSDLVPDPELTNNVDTVTNTVADPPG